MEKSLKPGRLIKSHIVGEYVNKLKGSTSIFVTDFGGLTNKDLQDLRKRLKATSSRCFIAKNSLCRLALEELKIAKITEMVNGSCAISYGKGDAVSISKILVGFEKDNKNFKLKGGYADGSILTIGNIKELASLPSREVLLARLVYVMNSPITGLVSACSGITRKLLYALNEIIKTKEVK